MSWFTQVLVTAIASFVATNIDDIVILMIFFAQVNSTFRTKHIVAGQYLGFTLLILASLPGFFGALILPKAWIGLLGIVPIAIGMHQLLQREEEEDEPVPTLTVNPDAIKPSVIASLLAPQTYQVAAVTFANGGDNIGIYVPLFASTNWASLGLTLSVFFLLLGAWCAIAYFLTRRPLIADTLTRYGERIVPFVLMGLGIFILIENGTYSLLP
ncbi:MAG: cadmium resistance transporter [Leptolyngbyaceae bacterium]|nr:cadmium resistance transporter [Leptolyngbyaceae bacterium]